MSKYNYGHRSKHNWDEEEDCRFDDDDLGIGQDEPDF